MKNQDGYEAVPFPKIRQPVVDSLAQANTMPAMHSLMEVDVTDTRTCIREFRRKTGTHLSFTSFLTFCLAQAVDENKTVHAYRSRGKLLIYDQVDISVLIERTIGRDKAPIYPHVVKAANQKTLTEIHNEIRDAQGKDEKLSKTIPYITLYYYMPRFIRALLWRRWLGCPSWRKRLTGTVSLSSLGMFGTGTGWGIPVPTYNLCITVGGICKKPGVIKNEIKVREYLCITASFNHDIVDGAPAARFLHRFKELIEGGYGLE